jgi:hypothetical protein
VPQREIESLYETDDEDCQQTGPDPSDPVLVYEGVHTTGGDSRYHNHTVTPAK